MDDCGLVYLGGRWKVVEVRGQPVLVAGNELPWFKPAADLGTARRGARFPSGSCWPIRPTSLPGPARATAT